MPQETERVQVEFLGETFTIKGDISREEVRKTSDYLQEQIEFIQARFPKQAAKNVAILTAFTIANEFIRVRKDYEALVSILDRD
ncbi:MAG: cell division protein ZapA [Peptococcaceae bacterium]|nr:cell division protein ZapA [Peptococcaceae bacterium]